MKLVVPAGKLGGRSSRMEEDTQKRVKIKSRATWDIDGPLGH